MGSTKVIYLEKWQFTGRRDPTKAAARDSAVAEEAQNDPGINRGYVHAQCSVGIGYDYYIRRWHFPINTSSLVNTIILGATLQFTAESYVSDPTTVYLVLMDQADPDTVTINDYQPVSWTSGGSVVCSGAGNKVITLNSTALGWINRTGYTMFGLVSSRDFLNNMTASPETVTGFYGISDFSRHYLTVNYIASQTGGII